MSPLQVETDFNTGGRMMRLNWVAVAMTVLAATTGCSTLGISLAPGPSSTSEQTEALLAATRIPTTVPRERAQNRPA